MTEKLGVLGELLGDLEISEFAAEWIERSENDENAIRQVYGLLRKYNVKQEKIAAQAHLLGRDPETIERNYRHHVGLLRGDWKDRNSGKSLLLKHAELLGIPPETIEANVQYLNSIGTDYNDGMLLGTTPQTKRRKLGWLLREVFDYGKVPEEQKRETVYNLYDFVKEHPSILIKSIKTLTTRKEN